MHQYVYFSISSDVMSFEEIAAKISIEADERRVLGVERHKLNPSHPITHSWIMNSIEKNAPVDEQIESIVKRLRRHTQSLAELSRHEGVKVTMQVVRYLDNTWGQEEELVVIDGLEKLPGQHQLLGWHLDAKTIEFLHVIKAELDVDEYN